MDLTVRILSVLIGTILANSGYVVSQAGGGGIAISLGLGADLGDMAAPLIAMASNSQQLNTVGGPGVASGGGLDPAFLMNIFGTPSAHSSPVLFPSTLSTAPMLSSPLVFLPGSIGISDHPHLTAPTPKPPPDQSRANKDHTYVLKNEAFTALGNVGHVIRVPMTSPSASAPATVVLNQLPTSNILQASVPDTHSTNTLLQLPAPTVNLINAPVSSHNTVSITGEPVAMFNPGTGLSSEMAVLQASLTGQSVDMSGFAPPPFITGNSVKKIPRKSQDTQLTSRFTNTMPHNTQMQTHSTQKQQTDIENILMRGPGETGSVSASKPSSRKSRNRKMQRKRENVPNTRTGSFNLRNKSPPKYITETDLANTLTDIKNVPHVEDLVTSGIYPFEGSSAARTAALDRKMKIVSDLEKAIKASGSEPLHLEPLPKESRGSLTTSISGTKLDQHPILSKSRSTNKASLTISDTSTSHSESLASNAHGGQNVAVRQTAFESNTASISAAVDSNVEPKVSPKIADPSFNEPHPALKLSERFSNNAGKKRAKLSFVTPTSLPRTAKITIPYTPTNIDLQNGVPNKATGQEYVTLASDSNIQSAGATPQRSDNKTPLANDSSPFLSQAPKEISVKDPNYITVLGNVIGVIDGKDITAAGSLIDGNIPPGVASFLNEQGISQDSTRGVLTGSNGAPITNMAGIRIPTFSANAAKRQQQPSFGVPQSSFLNGGSVLPDRNVPFGSAVDTAEPASMPSGTFIIGAGQPNSRVVSSDVLSNTRSSLPAKPDTASRNLATTDIRAGDAETNTNQAAVDSKPQRKQQQGFAVDLSAFAPPTYTIPSFDIPSFDSRTPGKSAKPDVVNQNSNEVATEPSKQQMKNIYPVEAIRNTVSNPISIDIPTPTVDNAIDVLPKESSQAVSDFGQLSNSINQMSVKPSPIQEVVNVEAGWANSLFPMDMFTQKLTNMPPTPIKKIKPAFVNFDTKVKNTISDIPVNKPYEIKNTNNSPTQNHNGPVVSSIFTQNNLQPLSNLLATSPQKGRPSSGPSVDFMTSFLNNPNLGIKKNIAANQIFSNVGSLGRDKHTEAVDQFGVADIYTRKQRLDKGQWRNLLSLVSDPNSKPKGNGPNAFQYETLNAQKNANPGNSNVINKSPRPGFLKHRGDASTSIRTMFEAPGVANSRPGTYPHRNPGLESGFTKQVNMVFTVPQTREFVASSPIRNSASNSGSPTKSITMPIFPSAGVQRNLVAAPQNTRAFDTGTIDLGPQNPPGSQQAFTLGDAIVVGNSGSPGASQGTVRGTPIALDASNLNRFASTGLRLGQPVETVNSRTLDIAQPMANLNAQFINNPDAAARASTNRGSVVFGASGSGEGRTLGVKTVGSSATPAAGTAPSSAVCKYMPDPTSQSHFVFEYRGFRHRFRCALGTAYDPAECQCSLLVAGTGDCLEVHMDFNSGKIEDSSVNRLPIGVQNVEITNKSTPLTGIAVFGENSKLTIWRYQNFDFRDHVMLKVQFRPGSGGARFQPLITNCDNMGGAPSIGIVYDSQLQEVLLVLQTDNDTNKELTFKINPNEWNDVTYIYDGQEFIGIVNGVRRYVSRQDPHLLGIIGGEIKSLPTQGLIEIRDAAIVLGYCPRWGHYVGAMVDIQVYTCIPRDFRLE